MPRYLFVEPNEKDTGDNFIKHEIDRSVDPIYSVNSVKGGGYIAQQIEIESGAFEDLKMFMESRFKLAYHGEINGNDFTLRGLKSQMPDASEIPEGFPFFATDEGVTYYNNGTEYKRDETVEWMFDTGTFTTVQFVYTERAFLIGATGVITPTVIGGTEPVQRWAVIGTLPSEFTFDEATGQITYDTTGSPASSGSFQVVSVNPAGTSDPYDFDWSIGAGGAIDEYTNSENRYAGMRLSPSGYGNSSEVFIKNSFHGTTTSILDGTIIEDSTSPIYIWDRGNGLFDYMIKASGYSYWLLFKRSSTDPHDLANGLISDLDGSLLSYTLVCPHTDDFTVDGVTYPSDQSDVHYLTAAHYLTAGVNSALDGFMSGDGTWSYGFTLTDEMPLDGLGRCMFTRNLRNWVAFYLGHQSFYSRMLVGNGSSRAYSSYLPATVSALAAGTKIHVTYDGSNLSIYANGTQLFSMFALFYLDAASATDSLAVHFGYGPESDANQSSRNYSHGFWQGVISDLWIHNTSIEDGSGGIPAGASHAWPLNESSGNTFAPSKGSVTLTGAVAS